MRNTTSNYKRLLLALSIWAQLLTYSNTSVPRLHIQTDDQEIVLANGAEVKAELYTGEKIKGSLFLIDKNTLLIDGKAISLLAIQRISVHQKELKVYLGKSATADKKSVVAAFNTEGTSVKSYLLWYVQEFFKSIPEQLNLKNVFGQSFDRSEGAAFHIKSHCFQPF